MKPLISVIIPVYNVEPYICKCINSVLEQTYNNLEIIIVDDGSTDQCGSICDSYASRDERIRVIHKENGGLSSARNTGLDICQGEYISFIDSDDFVAPFFIEIMYESIKRYDSDICSLKSGVSFTNDREADVVLASNNKDYRVSEIDAFNAIKMMFYQKIPNGAQWRLYHRHIFDNIRFPIGYLFEDVATTHKAFMKADKISLIDARLYAYRLRKDGIVRMKFSEKKLICIPISEQIIEDIRSYNTRLLEAAYSRAFAINYQVFLQIPHDNKEARKKVWAKVLEYRRKVIMNTDPEVRFKNRAGAVCTYLGKDISYAIAVIYKSWKKRKEKLY